MLSYRTVLCSAVSAPLTILILVNNLNQQKAQMLSGGGDGDKGGRALTASSWCGFSGIT